jgi:hypothetical protein
LKYLYNYCYPNKIKNENKEKMNNEEKGFIEDNEIKQEQ